MLKKLIDFAKIGSPYLGAIGGLLAISGSFLPSPLAGIIKQLKEISSKIDAVQNNLDI